MHLTLERTSLSTLLGIRFWDPVFDRQVNSGLRVTAWQSGDPDYYTSAFVTASGIYAFQDLPGMRDYERATAEDPAPGAAIPFTIAIDDLERRFTPLTLALDLPLPYRGVYPTAAPLSPPDEAPLGFYLFSAPSRQPTAATAVIHAWLQLNGSEEMAANAVLVAEVGGDPWFGIADENGRATILLPYPSFNRTLGASPPIGPAPSQQQWPVTVSVRYEPGVVNAPVDRVGRSRPEIRTLLQQGTQPLWQTPAGPPSQTATFDLAWGQELVLRTGVLPVLRIGP